MGKLSGGWQEGVDISARAIDIGIWGAYFDARLDDIGSQHTNIGSSYLST